MTYQSALNYLYSRLPVFHNIGAAAYKPGLENTRKILDCLDNPHLKFTGIHIAGTNGKGSVSHTLAAIAQLAGYRTGLYTSPHLIDFGERIRINGQTVEQQFVIDFVEKSKEIVEQIQPSFFELTMAMAFDYFAKQKVDIAVIETGLGGRLDSTNIITPALSVITNISFDHIQFLGDTLEKIAEEKAGIIKKNVPAVIGEWQAETHKVFEQKALEMSSPLYYAGEPLEFIRYDSGKMLCSAHGCGEITVGLTGNYQLKNMATVLKTVKILNGLKKFSFPPKAVLSGIENVAELTGLRGRWETVGASPHVITDTGHNEAGISYIAEQLKEQKYNKLHIVFGVVNDKDVTSMLSLLPADAEYYFTQANTARALPAENLTETARKFGLKGNPYKTVEIAYQSAKNNAAENDLIFVGGSNFVVGEFLNTVIQ